ncbi:MAG TPA: hypothetical protein VGB19_13150 [Actinomycetota bacterium]
MSIRVRPALVAVGIGLFIAGAVTATAIAGTGRSTVSGGAVERVGAARGSTPTNTSSTAFQDVTGASVKITVPDGQHAILVARFTTQEDCNVGDGSPSGSCLARIAVNGHEMQPATGGTVIDTVSAGHGAGIRSAALDRSSAVLGPGTYSVRAQIKVTSALMVIEVSDWHLTVERVRA